jgi:multidrug efflux system outer membrane protein
VVPLTAACLLCTCLLSACAAWSGSSGTDDARKPAQSLPASWNIQSKAVSPAPGSSAAQGWSVLGDAQIEDLISEALHNNADMERAMARVDASRAALQIANADRWPAVFANGGASRGRSSDVARKGQPAGAPAVTEFYHGNLQVQYEVDVWGKAAQASAAARANLLSLQANADAVRIAVAAQTAQSVYAVRAFNAQTQAVRHLVEQQREALALQQKRVELGAGSSFDLHQAEAEVAGNEARLPLLETQRSQAETALAVLLGRNARDVYEANFGAGTQALLADAAAPVAVVVPEGLPSELLLRRPDLRAREQALVAAQANIAAARANYFPSVTLTGSVGSESASFADLFKGPGFIWSLAASLTQPIWQAGRLFAQTDQAIAQRRLVEEDYREAVATAFKEVRDAVVAQDQNRLRFELARTQAQALERALELVKLREHYGAANRLEAIDAERQWLLASVNAIDARREQQQAVVNLVRALGGGWTADAR